MPGYEQIRKRAFEKGEIKAHERERRQSYFKAGLAPKTRKFNFFRLKK